MASLHGKGLQLRCYCTPQSFAAFAPISGANAVTLSSSKLKKPTNINPCKNLAPAFLICQECGADAGAEGDEKSKGDLQFV